jgi:hypothetical protein
MKSCGVIGDSELATEAIASWLVKTGDSLFAAGTLLIVPPAAVIFVKRC